MANKSNKSRAESFVSMRGSFSSNKKLFEFEEVDVKVENDLESEGSNCVVAGASLRSIVNHEEQISKLSFVGENPIMADKSSNIRVGNSTLSTGRSSLNTIPFDLLTVKERAELVMEEGGGTYDTVGGQASYHYSSKLRKGKNNSDDCAVKKDRGIIFTTDEVYLLCALVDKYKEVLESKKTDGETWNQKREFWKKLEDEFNARGLFACRVSMCLQNKWNNMKTKARQEYARARQHVLDTGGELISVESIVSPLSKKIMDITTSIPIQGKPDSPDCDSRRSTSKPCVELYAEISKNKENLPKNYQGVQEEIETDYHERPGPSSAVSVLERLIVEEEDMDDYLEGVSEVGPSDFEGVSESAPPVQKSAGRNSRTPASLRTPQEDLGIPASDNAIPRKNNKRSYQLHNSNLEIKGKVIRLQEKYYESLVRLQTAEEARKKSEIEWLHKKQKLEEEEYKTRTKKVEEFWDLKIRDEKESFERQKLYDEHLHSLKVKSLLNEAESIQYTASAYSR